MEIKLTNMEPEDMHMVRLMTRIATDNYDRDDCAALRKIADKALQRLIDADVMHVRSAFSMSSVRAALDNDIKPLFFETLAA